MLAHGTPEQIDRWLRPGLRGESQDAYAVTEEHAGSDPSGIATTARAHGRGLPHRRREVVRDVGRRRGGLHRRRERDRGRTSALPTLFLVERGTPGIEIVDDPPFTHAYPHGHPTVRFTGVEVPADAVLGGVGAGDDLQRAWFTEERLGIAARGCGAMWRLLEESVAWATAREQGGARIYDHQGVSFPLADSAADAAAGRALTLGVCALADDPAADPKLVHGKASMAKLFVSERAWVCADRAVQTFGGRGYMRTNVAERFLRELRVDRIWEGTSEIQRLIVARSMERRGVERLHPLSRWTSPGSCARGRSPSSARPRAPRPTPTRRCATSPRSATTATVWGVHPTHREVLGRPRCSRRSPISRRPPTRSSSRSRPPACRT